MSNSGASAAPRSISPRSNIGWLSTILGTELPVMTLSPTRSTSLVTNRIRTLTVATVVGSLSRAKALNAMCASGTLAGAVRRVSEAHDLHNYCMQRTAGQLAGATSQAAL